jgi:hypothetical protein
MNGMFSFNFIVDGSENNQQRNCRTVIDFLPIPIPNLGLL